MHLNVEDKKIACNSAVGILGQYFLEAEEKQLAPATVPFWKE